MDDSVYRRTIDELTARYLLEPTLRDLFVEGSADVALFSWYFHALGLKVSSYQIATVQVPSDILRIAGNRGRVVALAESLERVLPPENQAVRCVIDRDLDVIFKAIQESRLLWLTDYACIDSYVWTDSTIRKMFGLILRRNIGDDLKKAMSKVLRLVFDVLKQSA